MSSEADPYAGPSTEETHCDWSFLRKTECGGKCCRNSVCDPDLLEANRL